MKKRFPYTLKELKSKVRSEEDNSLDGGYIRNKYGNPAEWDIDNIQEVFLRIFRLRFSLFRQCASRTTFALMRKIRSSQARRFMSSRGDRNLFFPITSKG